MRVQELYRDFGVEIAPEGHKHQREGWVNTACPFCTGNPGFHLGYNTYGDYFHCHRCGGHFPDSVISKILHINIRAARDLIKKYGGVSLRSKKEPKVKVNLHPYKYPTGEIKLLSPHIKYLENRRYDPEKLQKEWGITGTGPFAYLDKINYSKRLLAPIYWQGKEVSFQTRDVTGRHPKKYLACPQARELVEHQKIVYGNLHEWGPRGICVEGITDVWRLGAKSFAVFGIEYTPAQVREIAKIFTEVVVVFDPEPQAQRQADKLVAELEFRGLKAWKEVLDTDPGDMQQDDADSFVRNLLSHDP